MSSDEDGAALMAAFQKKPGPIPISLEKAQSPVSATGSIPKLNSGAEDGASRTQTQPKTRQAVCVRVQPVQNRDQYTYFEPHDEVEEVLREFSRKGDMRYEVRLFGKASKQVSLPGKSGRFGVVKAE
jgi:hypothetical protein